MKLYLFSGFLGSGKTLSILSFAHYLIQTADYKNSGKKLVIIENEVGDVDYDESLLEDVALEVRNFRAGCICCTLNIDLLKTLQEISDLHDPDYVIFEPTGIAFPDRISDSVQAKIKNVERIKTIAIADVERWEALIHVAPELIKAQLAEADVILINKIDLAKGSLDQMEAHIREFNADAAIYKISATRGIPDELWERVLHD